MTATAAPSEIHLWRSTIASTRSYQRSVASNAWRKTRAMAASLRTSPGLRALASRAESIGSSVKEMKSEMSTAALMVMPNCLKNWPTMPGMNATGTNTATRESVVARTARPTSFVPREAATAGSSPLSSRCVIASRTTTASSMRSPIARDSARSVIWFSV